MTPDASPPRPDDAKARAWSAGFASLEQEFEYRVDEIDGRVPPALRGTLFRTGSGRNDLNGQWFPHWFDGDGMISAIAFDDSGIRYLNRYVRTDNYVNETREGRVLYRGFGPPVALVPPADQGSIETLAFHSRALGGRSEHALVYLPAAYRTTPAAMAIAPTKMRMRNPGPR